MNTQAVEKLASALWDLLSSDEAELLAKTLAPKMAEQAAALDGLLGASIDALHKMEDIERDSDAPWGSEVMNLRSAISEAGGDP